MRRKIFLHQITVRVRFFIYLVAIRPPAPPLDQSAEFKRIFQRKYFYFFFIRSQRMCKRALYHGNDVSTRERRQTRKYSAFFCFTLFCRFIRHLVIPTFYLYVRTGEFHPKNFPFVAVKKKKTVQCLDTRQTRGSSVPWRCCRVKTARNRSVKTLDSPQLPRWETHSAAINRTWRPINEFWNKKKNRKICFQIFKNVFFSLKNGWRF